MGDTMPGLTDLHCALSLLVKPADEASKGDLHDILELNIKNALMKLNIEDIKTLQTLQDIKCAVTADSSTRWKFVCVTLHILLSMKDHLKNLTSSTDGDGKSKPPPDILSVSQQKTIRTCLQFVVSMGMLPSLIPGVGISLASRCTNAQNLKGEDLVIIEKYERLSGVTRGLLACCEHPNIRSIIVAHHLGDLMAALSQISFAPLKKPVSTQQRAQNPTAEDFIMTQDLWDRFQKDRSYFRSRFVSFIWQVYQPLVIRELLLLHGAAGLKRAHNCSRTAPPAWLKRACVQLLVHCLMRPRGVSALIRALCDSEHDTGKDWQKIETVVELITTVHTANSQQYYRNICAQVLQMLCGDDTTNLPPNTFMQIQLLVAVRCVEILYKREPEMITKHFTETFMSPLDKCCKTHIIEERVPPSEDGSNVFVTEADMTKCIICMYRIFVEYSTENNALPSETYLPIISVLFSLYCKIYKSPSFLISKVQKLLIKFLSGLETEIMGKIFKACLFGDSADGVILMNKAQFAFAFGPSGGVQVVMNANDKESASSLQDAEENGDCLLALLASGDSTGNMTTNLFMMLLHIVCGDSGISKFRSPEDTELLDLEEDTCGADTKEHYIAVKLLSVLADSTYVHEKINDDPNCLIDYLLYMLQRDFKYVRNGKIEMNEGEAAIEDLIMVIMTVAVALGNCISKDKPVDWKAFERIVEPLKMIQESVENEELKALANEVYNTVITRGVIQETTEGVCLKKTQGAKPKISKKKKKKQESQGSSESKPTCRGARDALVEVDSYKEALLYVCSSSVPLRGHGLIQMTKLITQGKEDAKNNKHIILKLFQDDLKHDDSYIYLLAVNGLAAMANMCPDVVIRSLVREYSGDTEKKDVEDIIDLRLKVGEVLVRVSRTLDPNATTYIPILLNAFLRGSKDPDPLIRTSSLSNLGHVCKAVGFRVQSVIQEILVCVKGMIQLDPVMTVRAAAAMVMTLLLQGLGEDTFRMLGEVLIDIYRGLKLCYQKETSDVVKLHVQLSLEEINKISHGYLCPKERLQKKLFILDAPE